MVTACRKRLESLWTGRCAVYVLQENQNPDNKRTEFVEVEVITDQPCRLSYKSIVSAENADHASAIKQSTVLFIAPEIAIPPGSKIVVSQNRVTGVYKNSGEPAVHSNHQEISLDLLEGWA